MLRTYFYLYTKSICMHAFLSTFTICGTSPFTLSPVLVLSYKANICLKFIVLAPVAEQFWNNDIILLLLLCTRFLLHLFCVILLLLLAIYFVHIVCVHRYAECVPQPQFPPPQNIASQRRLCVRANPSVYVSNTWVFEVLEKFLSFFTVALSFMSLRSNTLPPFSRFICCLSNLFCLFGRVVGWSVGRSSAWLWGFWSFHALFAAFFGLFFLLLFIIIRRFYIYIFYESLVIASAARVPPSGPTIRLAIKVLLVFL